MINRIFKSVIFIGFLILFNNCNLNKSSSELSVTERATIESEINKEIDKGIEV
jgi:hypothetical protein